MKQDLRIDEDEMTFEIWAKDAVIARAEVHKVTHSCPHCGCNVYYPLVASRSGIESIKDVLRTMKMMSDRCGLGDAALSALMRDMLLEMQKKTGVTLVAENSENKQ